MAVWLARAGKNGEREDFALEHSVAVIGWGDLPDLSPADTKEKLTELMRHAYPDQSKHTIANYAGQVWAFRGRMQEGDLVVLPLKTARLPPPTSRLTRWCMNSTDWPMMKSESWEESRNDGPENYGSVAAVPQRIPCVLS